MPRMADPSQQQQPPPPEHQQYAPDRCAQCQAEGVPLLAPDEPLGMAASSPGDSPNKPRYCNTCMIGKKVQVFWPVDDSWYTGTVYEFDPNSGEHLLRYEDGDAEWVRIGESSPPDESQLPQGAHEITPDTPSLETPQASPERPPEGMPGPPPSHPHAPPPGMTYYTQHGMPVYSPSGAGGGPPPVVYTMYPPPHPAGGESSSTYPPPPDGDPYAGGSMMVAPPQHSAHGQPPSDSRRKSGPKAWTKEEDACLLRLVQSMQMPMKWSVVALSLPGRTGKQCRERYVNHLNPRLKVSDWNPVEDATIFHLYSTHGSHWSSMSKVIPGRTDNGIKNRFHNLRRQVEREDENRQKKAAVQKDYEGQIRSELIREFPKPLQGNFDSLWAKDPALPILAGETTELSDDDVKAYFGPFVQARDGQVCVRCGFIMPSVQTGRTVCEKTGWCVPCALLPSQLSGNLLRECLALRREQNPDLRAVVEGWGVPPRKVEEQRQESEST